MKKMCRSVLAILLCCALLVPASPAVFAAEKNYLIETSDGTKNVSKALKGLLNAVDVVINGLMTAINLTVPTPKTWEDADSYSSAGFMPGQAEFLSSPADGTRWSMGFASASILDGQDVQDGKHYVGGSLSVSDKTVTEVYDDLRVRTVAMNDGSGRGTTVFAVVDGYGLSSTDVRAIRQEMAAFCKANHIISLNIGVLHQHSAVDTFGMNGSVFKALGNGVRNLLGKPPVNGQNAEYMRNLFDKTEQTVCDAVSSMTAGKMYYSTVDAKDYVRDKRPPYVMDTDLNLFRFVPDDGSRETWMTTYTAHCVGNGAGQREITGDYPYYMEQVIRRIADANFMLLLGAEQGSSQRRDNAEIQGETEPLADVKAYGRTLAELLIAKGGDNAVEVPPLLNIRHKEILFTIQNPILTFAGKMGLVTNKVVRRGFMQYEVVSEIGYMELGDALAVALIPGELAAELAYGGCLTAETSWRNKDWTMPSLQEMTGTRQLLIFGIMNDQVGYIIPENDYMALAYEDNKSLELVSMGDEAAGILCAEYDALLREIRG